MNTNFGNPKCRVEATRQLQARYSPLKTHALRLSPVCSAVLASFALLPTLAYANCTTAGNDTTCDTSAPSPWTSTIGSGHGTAAGRSVTVGAGAQIATGDASAIALSDSASIVVQSDAVVRNTAVSNPGTYGTGANVIDFRSNGTLTVEQGASVISAGTEPNGEAVNVEGTGSTIVNNGTIRSVNTPAIWFQNLTGTNTVINNATGVIAAPTDVMGASGDGAVDFTNRGALIGNLVFADGNDSLHLYTGSSITGSIDGSGGSDVLTLNGAGSATLPGRITRFETLQKQDSGTWTVTGQLNAIGVTSTQVQQGTLVLTGNNTAYRGSMTVDAAGTLQGSSQTLPGTIADNGLVRFAQSTDGTYAGLLAGTGALEKTGAGTLVLAPAAGSANAYSGGTAIRQGVLAVAADNALGAPTGGVTFDGGTLRLGSSFDLASSRPLSIASAGGTIDTQQYRSTIAQNVTGTGSLTKLGQGTLILDGANTWSGGTVVSEGTLAVGEAASRAAASIAGNASVASGATLGGYGTVGGNVANSGTIAVANALAAFAGGGNGTLTIGGQLVNAGRVQIAGSQSVGNTLRVGSYVGNQGIIAMNAALGGDDSPTDKLVVNGGTATGSTTLSVTNVGGNGAVTTGNGIELVQAANGATTDASAFSLAGGSVKAGAYVYYLAKGGVSAGTSQNWYLRNTVGAQPNPPLADTSDPGVSAAAGSPVIAAGADAIALYRPEVALYAELPAVARGLGVMQLDDFHARQGTQSLLSENGKLPAAWARAWGGHTALSQSGDVAPAYSGSMFGTQIGQDLYADTSPSGHRNHYGLFLGFARATGDVKGFAVGVRNTPVGHLALNAYSVGGYWTHIGPGGWYTDTVLMGSALDANFSSRDGVTATTHGRAFSGSVEGGLPIAIGHGLTLEPQLQLIWQHQSFNDLNDGVSTAAFDNGSAFVGRAGLRLAANFDAAHVSWQPYLRLNLLRSTGASDRTTFAGATAIDTSVGKTTGRIDAGLVARLTKQASAYVMASYGTNLGGEHERTVSGNAGVRWSW